MLFQSRNVSAKNSINNFQFDPNINISSTVRIGQFFSYSKCETRNKDSSLSFELRNLTFLEQFSYRSAFFDIKKRCGYLKVINKKYLNNFNTFKIVNNQTILLTLEMNFYNRKTNLWTILKGKRVGF